MDSAIQPSYNWPLNSNWVIHCCQLGRNYLNKCYLILLILLTFVIIKVQLTPILFSVCDIFRIILERNVIYLYSKNPHLHQLFTIKVSGNVIRWIFGATNKEKLICNSPLMTSYPKTLTIRLRKLIIKTRFLLKR